MQIKGLRELEQHVPELAAPWGVLRAAVAIAAVFVATTLFFVAADRYFAAWMPDGEIVVMALGFLLLSRFFSQRERYRQKYGQRAFYEAFIHFNIPGLGILAASIGHLGYIAGPALPDVPWRPWLMGIGYLLVAAGVLMWLRAVTSFGLDSLLMLYVYQPQDGPPLTSGLYGFLRHPVYSAALHIGIGLAMVHANWYALLVAVLLPLFFFGWVRLVEERELMQRFPGYADYRRRVPAFIPRFRKYLRFWRLLLLGS